MADDMNTPIVIAHLYDAVRVINSCKEGKMNLSAESIETLKTTFHTFLFEIMGLPKDTESESGNDLSAGLMDFILRMRSDAKSKKDFATSDLIRDELAKLNIQIKDTKEGATWTYEER
jgi:cysteinyl-tRNA synthetase